MDYEPAAATGERPQRTSDAGVKTIVTGSGEFAPLFLSVSLYRQTFVSESGGNDARRKIRIYVYIYIYISGQHREGLADKEDGLKRTTEGVEGRRKEHSSRGAEEEGETSSEVTNRNSSMAVVPIL